MTRSLALALAGGFALLAGAALLGATRGGPSVDVAGTDGVEQVGPGEPSARAAGAAGLARAGATPTARSSAPTSSPDAASAPARAGGRSPDDLGATTLSDLSPDDLADPAALRERRRAGFAARAVRDADALRSAAGLPTPDPELLAAARAAADAARPPP